MIIFTFPDLYDRNIFEVIKEAPETSTLIPLIIRLIDKL